MTPQRHDSTHYRDHQRSLMPLAPDRSEYGILTWVLGAVMGIIIGIAVAGML